MDTAVFHVFECFRETWHRILPDIYQRMKWKGCLSSFAMNFLHIYIIFFKWHIVYQDYYLQLNPQFMDLRSIAELENTRQSVAF